MKTDEILAGLQAVMDEAGKTEQGEQKPLNDDQVKRYEDLEGKLESARKNDEIQKRHAANKRVVTPTVTHTGNAKPEDDQLTRAWNHYMRTGKENQDIQELRAQSTLIGSEGGFLVPETFRNKIVERMVAFGGLASVVENITTSDGSPMRWTTIDDTANSGELVAENAAPAGGADLVFGEANLGAYKYMAVGAGGLPLRVSVEALQDASIDMEAKIANWMARRLKRVVSADLVSGSGVGEPEGIVTGLTGIQTAANNAITYADLLNYVHSVDPDYRASGNCRWAFNDSFLETVRGLVDLNGRPLLVDATQGIENMPGGPRLLGFPVTIDQGFSNFTNNSPTVNYGVFGDLTEGYVYRQVKDFTLVVDPYTRALNGQVQFTAWMRADGVQQNTNAYVALTGKS